MKTWLFIKEQLKDIQQLFQVFILKILKNTIPGGQSVKVSCQSLVVNVEKVLLLSEKTFASKSRTLLRARKCTELFHKYDFVDGGCNLRSCVVR